LSAHSAHLINLTIAVVVFSVANFRMAGEDIGITIVAVTSTDTLGVAIVVVLSGWHVAITVVVVTITNLWSARIGLVVEVIAVTLTDHPTIVVVVVLIRRQVTVAVGVATVADFWGTEISSCELLIAVFIVRYITGRLATFAGTRTWSTTTVTVEVSPVHVAVPAAVAIIAVEASVAACLWCTGVLLATCIDPVLHQLKLVGIEAVAVGTMMRSNGYAVE